GTAPWPTSVHSTDGSISPISAPTSSMSPDTVRENMPAGVRRGSTGDDRLAVDLRWEISTVGIRQRRTRRSANGGSDSGPRPRQQVDEVGRADEGDDEAGGDLRRSDDRAADRIGGDEPTGP